MPGLSHRFRFHVSGTRSVTITFLAWHLTPETCSRNDVLIEPARKAAGLGHLAKRARCEPPHEPAWSSGRKFRNGNQAASALLEGQVGLAACADESTG